VKKSLASQHGISNTLAPRARSLLGRRGSGASELRAGGTPPPSAASRPPLTHRARRRRQSSCYRLTTSAHSRPLPPSWSSCRASRPPLTHGARRRAGAPATASRPSLTHGARRRSSLLPPHDLHSLTAHAAGAPCYRLNDLHSLAAHAAVAEIPAFHEQARTQGRKDARTQTGKHRTQSPARRSRVRDHSSRPSLTHRRRTQQSPRPDIHLSPQTDPPRPDRDRRCTPAQPTVAWRRRDFIACGAGFSA